MTCTQFNLAVTLENTVSWSVNIMIVRFKVLTLVAVKVINFWDVRLCGVVHVCECHAESHEHPAFMSKCQTVLQCG